MKNEFNKVLFIINNYSGSGSKAGIDQKIIDGCKAHRVNYSLEYTQGRGHATELAQTAVADNAFDLVVAVGGDGTVNEVARGLLHSKTPMGILPKGSGNGLARHLRIPLKIEDAVKSLFESETIAMDTFTLNGKLSLNVSGVGFDGHIANLFATATKRGLSGYARVTLQQFAQFREFEARVTVNGKTETRKTFIIAIANSSQYGNNARIAPAASVCDEILHVCFLKKVPPYRVDFIYDFFSGKIDQTNFCEFLETKKMTIEVSTPVAFHIDGEPSGESTLFDIEILPSSLQILAPSRSLKI